MARSQTLTGNLLHVCLFHDQEMVYHVSNQMLLYLLAVIFIFEIEFPMFSMSQPATYDFITKTKSCGLLYPALHVKYPLVISHAALTSRVQLFETIYGTEWAGSWSNNPFLAIFIITSYKAAYVCLPDAKYRYSLPHAPTRT